MKLKKSVDVGMISVAALSMVIGLTLIWVGFWKTKKQK